MTTFFNGFLITFGAGFLATFGALCFYGGITSPHLWASVLLPIGIVCLLQGVGRLSEQLSRS